MINKNDPLLLSPEDPPLIMQVLIFCAYCVAFVGMIYFLRLICD